LRSGYIIEDYGAGEFGAKETGHFVPRPGHIVSIMRLLRTSDVGGWLAPRDLEERLAYRSDTAVDALEYLVEIGKLRKIGPVQYVAARSVGASSVGPGTVGDFKVPPIALKTVLDQLAGQLSKGTKMTRWTSQMQTDWGFNRQQFDQVVRYMRQNVEDSVDNQTGEVNATSLAEDAAHGLGQSDWLDDDTHPIFDIAVDVADEYERRHR
jgi:hypothetical protein